MHLKLYKETPSGDLWGNLEIIGLIGNSLISIFKL